MERIKKILYSLIIILLALSCSKEGNNDGILWAKVVVDVDLFDEYYSEIEDTGDVTITFLGVEDISPLTTDSEGKVSVDKIPVGVYNIEFSKPGFGKIRDFGVRILPGPDPNRIYEDLYAVSENSLSNITVSYATFDGIPKLRGEISKNPDPELTFRVFYSDSPDVSYTQYLETSMFFISIYTLHDDQMEYEFELPGSNLLKNNPLFENTVYAVIHGDNGNGYYDFENLETLFSSINPTGSNTFHFTLP